MLPLLGVGFLGCAVALQLQTRPLGRSSSTVRRSRPRVPPLHSAALQYNDLANADVEAREHLWGAAERRASRDHNRTLIVEGLREEEKRMRLARGREKNVRVCAKPAAGSSAGSRGHPVC